MALSRELRIVPQRLQLTPFSGAAYNRFLVAFMKYVAILFPLFVASNCAAAPGQADPDKDDVVKLRLELLHRGLKIARLEGKPEEELRVLLDEGIASGHSEVRAAAFREISSLPEARRQAAVPEVLRRFVGARETFKVQAVGFFGRVPGAEAEAAVMRAVQDPGPAVRRAAAAALKASPKEQALRALISLLGDEDREVRLEVLDALGASRSPTVLPPLLESLGREKDEALLEKIADALGRVGAPESVDALVRLLQQTPRDAIRWSCINSLGKIGDFRAVPPLLPFLEGPHAPLVRQVTAEALGKLKAVTALPLLSTLLRQAPEEELRRAAAASIGQMAPADAVATTLLPAYLAETSETVRAATWKAMLELAGTNYDPLEGLTLQLLDKGKREAALEVCTHIHALKLDEALRPRYLKLEEQTAGAAFDARDFKGALPHFRQAVAYAPDRPELKERMAACHRELKDHESAIKLLREAETRRKRGDPEWWKTRLLILESVAAGRDAEPVAAEAHALLAMNPPAHPEERRKLLEQALREGALRLVRPLAEAAEPQRKALLEPVLRVGKAILTVLIAEAEGGKPAPGVLPAGDAITGTISDPARLKEAAAAWRAWLAQAK